MRHLNPRIYEKTYPGTRTKYWLVKASLPNGRYHQKKHASAVEAEKDRIRLLREHGGGGISSDELRICEIAQHKLTTCAGHARGHSILEAVDFFVEHYRDPNSAPRVELCIGAFFRQHVRKLREYSQIEYERNLIPFLRRFRKTSMSSFSPQVLTEYVRIKNGGVNLKKCLMGLFSFCAGGSKKIKSQHHWLDSNPANLIQISCRRTDHEIAVYTLEEVRNSIALALLVGGAMYWIWGYFTGMRPVETQKFWTLPEYGWNRVYLDAGYIVLNSEIAKDKRRRKIIIRPNLRNWLLYFRDNGESMFPGSMVTHRRVFRLVKRETIAAERRCVRDVIRHTYITYRAHAFDRSFAGTAAEAGNSERIIRDHYFDILTDQRAVDEYWSLTPTSFGLQNALDLTGTLDHVIVANAETPAVVSVRDEKTNNESVIPA